MILKGVKNVKIEWNRRYTTIAVYAILVLVFGVLFLYGVQNYREVKAWFSAALVTLRPFIFGFVIAYLLNPIYVFLDKKFLPWLTNNTINPPACRGLAIIVTYALTGGVLYLFSALVFPQIIISVSSIIGNLRIDLHVLSLPLAFILSQDQTLHCKKCFVYKSFAQISKVLFLKSLS